MAASEKSVILSPASSAACCRRGISPESASSFASADARVPSAARTSDFAASAPCRTPSTASRASDILASASSAFCRAAEVPCSTEARASLTAASTDCATTSLTVDTKAALIVSSSVVAPVSVIFGATGPAFSFT